MFSCFPFANVPHFYFKGELNWIEMYWGKVKRWIQCFLFFLLVILPVCRALKEMDHGKSGAQFEADFIKCLDEAALDLNFLRRVANKSFRYMHLYDAGATGALAEFANRKYQGHRCPPKSWLTPALKTEYKAKYKQHAKDSMIDWKQLKADQEAQRALVGSQQPFAANRRSKKPARVRRARSPSAAEDAAPVCVFLPKTFLPKTLNRFEVVGRAPQNLFALLFFCSPKSVFFVCFLAQVVVCWSSHIFFPQLAHQLGDKSLDRHYNHILPPFDPITPLFWAVYAPKG